MNELKIFENSEFGQVRTMDKDNEPWFVAIDIANALGYSNTRDAIIKHVDEEDKGVAKCDTLGGKQNLTIINESGVYSLIMASKLESARRFKRWVTSEVLPTLRKTGTYSMLNMSKELKAIIMVDNKTEELRNDFEEFKNNAPLFNIECEELSKTVRAKGARLMGYKSEAYNDPSLRGKVYSDIYNQLRREFQVNSYKAIKRCDFDLALEIIDGYTLPLKLERDIKILNGQIKLTEI